MEFAHSTPYYHVMPQHQESTAAPPPPTQATVGSSAATGATPNVPGAAHNATNATSHAAQTTFNQGLATPLPSPNDFYHPYGPAGSSAPYSVPSHSSYVLYQHSQPQVAGAPQHVANPQQHQGQISGHSVLSPSSSCSSYFSSPSTPPVAPEHLDQASANAARQQQQYKNYAAYTQTSYPAGSAYQPMPMPMAMPVAPSLNAPMGHPQHLPTPAMPSLASIPPALPSFQRLTQPGDEGIKKKKARRASSSATPPGPIPASTPTFVRRDEQGVEWIAFEYSKERVKTKHCIRCDIESVTVNQLDPKFKASNCIYPRAVVPPEEYTGNRQKYESECNCIGWALAYLNPSLQGQRGLIQRAVDSWRNTNADVSYRSRRVKRLSKKQLHEQRQRQPTTQFPAIKLVGPMGPIGSVPMNSSMATVPMGQVPMPMMGPMDATAGGAGYEHMAYVPITPPLDAPQ